tara:strand:- start:153 stop:440 length:288 start_codon:yes stop_codon:yes gene_type:complete
MDNGIGELKNMITITVYPAEEGFGCAVIEPKEIPLTSEYSIALTIAHGMVKMALENPNIIFDAGVESLTKLGDNEPNKGTVSITDMINKKKHKLH